MSTLRKDGLWIISVIPAEILRKTERVSFEDAYGTRARKGFFLVPEDRDFIYGLKEDQSPDYNWTKDLFLTKKVEPSIAYVWDRYDKWVCAFGEENAVNPVFQKWVEVFLRSSDGRSTVEGLAKWNYKIRLERNKKYGYNDPPLDILDYPICTPAMLRLALKHVTKEEGYGIVQGFMEFSGNENYQKEVDRMWDELFGGVHEKA